VAARVSVQNLRLPRSQHWLQTADSP
jgi:hypothetical protein